MARRHLDHWTGPRTLARVGEREAWLPAAYHQTSQFTTVHRASFDEVCRALPSDEVRPARWLDGSALIVIAAMRHRDVVLQGRDGSTQTLLPYGEMLIGPLVGYGRSRRALPVGRQSVFVLHMPVTTREAYALGRAQWNFPKFVADMDFREESRERSISLAEEGTPILTMSVRPGGVVLPERSPITTYTVKDARLLRTTLPHSAHVQLHIGRRAGALALGGHELAEDLRRLGIDPSPVMSYSYLDVRFLLPAGEPVGSARPYDGIDRAPRELGRYTVTYPSSGRLDQYARLGEPVSG